MKTTVEEVQQIAKIAKLRFTQEEAEEMTAELNGILTHLQSMKQGKLEEVNPLETNINKTVLRKDEALFFPDGNKLLQNLTNLHKGYIQVPKMMD